MTDSAHFRPRCILQIPSTIRSHTACPFMSRTSSADWGLAVALWKFARRGGRQRQGAPRKRLKLLGCAKLACFLRKFGMRFSTFCLMQSGKGIYMRNFSVAIFVIGALLAPSARASLIFSDNAIVSGNAVTASATFSISGTDLTILLQNTSPAALLEAPGNTLTGISFLLNGLAPNLSPVSAISPNAIFDSAACNVNACTGTNVNVGGEWGYGIYGGEEAVASAGYLQTGLPHNIGNFNGPNLQGPASLASIEFGIISANHGPLNGGLNGEALIEDTVALRLTIPAGFTDADIGSVNFIYGTAPDAIVPDAPPATVPEPGTLALLGPAFLGFAGMVRRRKHR